MHMMLDIETLGVKPGCVVMQVAMARFDHEQVYSGGPLWNIDLMDQLEAGLTIDPDTLQWWRDQDETARDLVVHAPEDRYRLREALQGIRRELAIELTDPRFKLWANPDVFDLPILANLFHNSGEEQPWPHWQTADARTFLWAAKIARDMRTKPKVPHYAMSDAKAQAEDVIHAAITLGIDLR